MVDDDPNEPEDIVAEISVVLRSDVEDRSVFMTVVTPSFYSDLESLVEKYNIQVSAFSIDMVNKSDLKDAGAS